MPLLYPDLARRTGVSSTRGNKIPRYKGVVGVIIGGGKDTKTEPPLFHDITRVVSKNGEFPWIKMLDDACSLMPNSDQRSSVCDAAEEVRARQ